MRIEIPAHLEKQFSKYLEGQKDRKPKSLSGFVPCRYTENGIAVRQCIHWRANLPCAIMSGNCVNSKSKHYYEEKFK